MVRFLLRLGLVVFGLVFVGGGGDPPPAHGPGRGRQPSPARAAVEGPRAKAAGCDLSDASVVD
eukprot:11003569-Lingulodinium_polyedra.AAC.1